MKHTLSDKALEDLFDGEVVECTFNEYEGYYYDNRVCPDELPKGWYVYALRLDDNHERIATIEDNNVIVNFGGWFITYGKIPMAHFIEVKDSTMNGVPYQEFPQIFKETLNGDVFRGAVSEDELEIIKSKNAPYKDFDDKANGFHAYKLKMSYTAADALVDELNDYLEENELSDYGEWFLGDRYERYVDVD